MKLGNKVAIVTGAGGGIGSAIAFALAKEGAGIVLTDIALKALANVANELKAKACRALVVKTDVTNSKEVKKMVRTALDKFGSIDILVNVAGGSAACYFHKSPDRYWKAVVDLNLNGTLICCHEVIKPMIRGGGGRIINIGSAAGIIGSSIGLAAYSAAKAGVIGFTKALAKELASNGINVNCVSPGPIETPLQQELDGETRKKIVADTYLKRLGKPEDVANLVLFLASDEANYITGQNYAVCGGRSLGW
jgi:NAD(P)-dependent dehydrogenase (short-subunit alcohol dehydrogenase family)